MKREALEMLDIMKIIRNARYYENNKERLQKWNMDKYYENKDIIFERKRKPKKQIEI